MQSTVIWQSFTIFKPGHSKISQINIYKNSYEHFIARSFKNMDKTTFSLSERPAMNLDNGTNKINNRVQGTHIQKTNQE